MTHHICIVVLPINTYSILGMTPFSFNNVRAENLDNFIFHTECLSYIMNMTIMIARLWLNFLKTS